MAPVLQYKSITKRYGKRVALDGVSLAIEPGEIFGFLGPNGAGKTTAIHLAMGLLRANSGSGTLLGQPFGDAPAHARLGFVPERPVFYPGTARNAIRASGVLNDVPAGELKRRTDDMLARVFLTDRAGDEVTKLSRGMQQRVALAQALLHKPDLLILDEPTSALDPVSRAQVRDILLEQRQQGRAVFLSSHLLSEVEQVADRVGYIENGKLRHVVRLADVLGAASEYSVRWSERGAPETLESRVPAAEQRAAIEQVWARGGEVISVTPVQRSLEEVFLGWAGQRGGSAGPGAEQTVAHIGDSQQEESE